MGLLDNFNFDDPGAMAFLRFGTGLLGSGGQTNRGIATGLGAMMEGNAADRKRKQEEDAMRLHAQMQQMQMQGLQNGFDDRAAAQRQTQALAGLYRTQGDQKTPQQQAIIGASMGPTVGAASQLAALRQPGQPGTSLFDKLMSEGEWLRQNGQVAAGEAKIAEALKNRPKYSTVLQDRPGADGQVSGWQFADDGSAPINTGLGRAPKMVKMDLGGVEQWVDENTLKNNQQFTKGYSPSDTVAMRGQDIKDRRDRELNAITRESGQTQVINDSVRGPMLVNKGTGVARFATGANGQPMQSEDAAKRQGSANRILPLLSSAEELIDKSTGSRFGSALDSVAQFGGYATEGAKAAAQLKVIEGNLMMNAPRFEGPQSDKDMMLYRQMAGQIGDPSVPPEIKKAALKTMREMHERTASQNMPAPRQNAPTRPPSAPMKGQTMSGYRFKGGDPADQNNWEKM